MDTPVLPPTQPYGAAQLQSLRLKAVVIAGDGSLPVFDNAADGVAHFLRAHGVADGSIAQLSASPSVIARNGVRSASLDHVLNAVAAMNPAPGEGCLVFASSHGAMVRGLILSGSGQEVLSPGALDRALVRGCGNAPTAVVVSGCFSGTFAQPPVTRDNRVILTASAPARVSFGCGAGREFTVYDKCLLDALAEGGTWAKAHESTAACVSRAEAAGHFRPSQPQFWNGSAVPGLPLP